MVMMAPPIVAAVEAIVGAERSATRVLAMAAGGRSSRKRWPKNWPRLRASPSSAVATRDRRAGLAILGAEQVSIGDYVLTGGELAATVIIDAVTRLLPGVIDAASVAEESHRDRLVEYPHYAPARLSKLEAPPVLLSGHHAEIARWRRQESVRRTARCPDLLAGAVITPEEREIAQEVLTEESQEGTDAKSVPPTREQI